MKNSPWALLVMALVLVGAGCNKPAETTTTNEPSPSDSATEDTYSPDQYSYLDGTYYDVYACNITESFCDYLDWVTVQDGIVDDGSWVDIPFYAVSSACDDLGCYFLDDFNDEWYFDF